MIVFTLSCCVLCQLLTFPGLFICSLFVCQWSQNSQTSWNIDIKAKQNTWHPLPKKTQRQIFSHHFTLVKWPSGGGCRCCGCHGDRSRGEGLPWAGERLTAAPLYHSMASTAALLALELGHCLPAVSRQGVFGAATRERGRHFLEVGAGESSSTVIEPFLWGSWDGGNPTACATAVVALLTWL